MPPQEDPRKVARLPPDEQIAHLTHQYETLHDRIQCVEDAQGEHRGQLIELRGDMTRLSSQVKKGSQLNRENNLLLREMKLLLTGQQTPGLEMPGLTAEFKLLKETVARWDTWHNRAVWVGMGLTSSAIGTLLYYAEKIKTIYGALLPHK